MSSTSQVRQWRRRRGSQALEFATTAPMLVLLLAGIVDYSRYFSQQWAVTHATRDAARAAAVAPLASVDGTAQAAALATLKQLGVDNSSAKVTTKPLTIAGQPALEVTVTVPHKQIFNMGLSPPISSAP